MPECPGCRRPIAMPGPRCVYCGRALDAPVPRPEAEAETPMASRALVVLEMDSASIETLADALGIGRLRAESWARRGGLRLLGILDPEAAERERTRLESQRLRAWTIPEQEVREASRPIRVLAGRMDGCALRLRSEVGEEIVEGSSILLGVKGPIAREYQTAPTLRRVSIATLEPGYRVHLHDREDRRPLELDPAEIDYESEATGSSLLRVLGWTERLKPAVKMDDRFRQETPVLAPAVTTDADLKEWLAGTARPKAKEARVVLDNLAQFRFYSAWRAAVERRCSGTIPLGHG